MTVFEVFEHVPDVQALMNALGSLRSGSGIILFSTVVTDDHIQAGTPLEWWYAAPRNGHISLYTKKSLAILAVRHGFRFRSLSEGIHVFYKNIPSWANRLFGVG
jgi:2-polyprenyl-3-methyl-5-hydroxy-6-metoxy-1,4-benzoquinol methylase